MNAQLIMRKYDLRTNEFSLIAVTVFKLFQFGKMSVAKNALFTYI